MNRTCFDDCMDGFIPLIVIIIAAIHVVKK